ncbi:MAG TPA: ASKHA domain-containing protein, partial [Anaerolineales bacterium]|nr:ASKHA domain-containing protein [Anaerolineales bacterium]
LGSTTVAAFLTLLDTGEVQAGGASLNQQTVYGADVISRIAAALDSTVNADRLHRLALASINQAVDSLKMSDRIKKRIQRVTIVGNVAMHHLLAKLPVDSLAHMPFQPYCKDAILDVGSLTGGIFAGDIQVSLPPLIGGFVGSDALACLAYFNFAQAQQPIAAIDLGTNGEVMVTDGRRILTASTAAGPAFEGVNISCGTRAVDGAITAAQWKEGKLFLQTIADQPPVGLTGSGLLSVVYELRKSGAIDASGRINPLIVAENERKGNGTEPRSIALTEDGRLALTQWDIRELQKAKGAIRAAIEILMKNLGLQAGDIQRFILTGSFGGQVDIDGVLALGMIPPVRREKVETIANGAGLGAAMFLSDEGMAAAVELAKLSEQIDLDLDPEFIQSYIQAMVLAPND